MEKTVNQKIISGDVLRYKKNKLASALALLGLVFNCLYFMVLYCMSERTFYTNLIGLSVLVNLFVLLAAFLSSEGVKNYKKHFAVLLIILAVIQVIRIFIYPVKVLGVDVAEGETFYKATGASYFGANLTASATTTIMIVYLIASAAFFVLSAVWGYIVAVRLEKFNKALAEGAVNVDATLKAMEEEESAFAVANPVLDEALKDTLTEEEAEDLTVHEAPVTDAEDILTAPSVDSSEEVL